jgi:Nif-specific regulatory protein
MTDTESADFYCYLTVMSGPRAGTTHMLDPSKTNQIGRGIECDIVLMDPICSRIHGELSFKDSNPAATGWWIKDLESRNGTFLRERQLNEPTMLTPGDRLRLGNTELTFYSADQPPTLGSTKEGLTESIVREAPVDIEDSGRLALAALRRKDNASQLMVLFNLSTELLNCDEPTEVQRKTLDTLLKRTKAEVVGFLWVDDLGELKPQMLLPSESSGVQLSKSLTQIVLEQRRAAWVSSHGAPTAESLRQFTDALCVPVINDGQFMGALHLYQGKGRFQDIDFEFSISVAQLLAVALGRARRQAQLAADHRRLVVNSAACEELIGESRPIAELKEVISRVAAASGPVLITGESGTGKELVAKAIHESSPRVDRPMLAVNCAAIPATLIESQLFGHAKGAFTGATDDHRGWFEQADTGTLFLDEIGELPLEAQAKLLRVLEGHSFQPVGGANEINVDVRVLAATNRNLAEKAAAKEFREDLYYRLSVFELKVPPLRDRDDDIGLLLDHFFQRFRNCHGRPGLELSDSARNVLLAYAWPGNVRQLRNVIDSAVVLSRSNQIEVEDLGLNDAGTEQLDTLKIDEWERRLIKRALKRTGGSVPQAAKLLGIGRATLYRKIDEYEIER